VIARLEEGHGRCCIMQSRLPEAQTAYALIVRRFKVNLR
jgi:hypothetical protein